MLVFLFLLGLALGAVSSSDERPMELVRGSCPSFWFSFYGRCYKYIATKMTWADAEFHCLSQGGNLVSIHSGGEEDFVKLLIKNVDLAQGPTWIGLSDIHKEGRWMWSDGCVAKFFFWNKGEPNNHRGEDCVHNNWSGRWNDRKCSSTFPSVCASRTTCP
ncbi:lactose-binding lectin l-2-like [Trematomus bernacchii]|uniref:lactose-binding lectin l-2-like n=1 Tax=Trematomus bernacchii TaxID=40690 RepID=UPI00146DEDA3|nr:lactose-binding lectin l-2-like [Trematomus bernacchii]